MRTLASFLAILAASTSQVLAMISHDGTCGGPNGLTCMSSIYGNCCSKDGFCGATAAYCGADCQLGFGICEHTKGTPSMDGTCGGSLGYTCEGSRFGDCCSQYGFCGSSEAYCDAGCNTKSGRCSTSKRSLAAGSSSASTLSALPSSSRTSAVSDHVIIPKSPDAISYVSTSTASSYAASMVSGSLSSSPSPASSPVEQLGTNGTTSVVATPSDTSAGSCTSTASAAEESCVRCEGQPGTDQYCGYDINTNYYEFTPKTCRTVEYTLTITNSTVAPDGVERVGFLVNGQMPGPVLEANWGDTVKVTVINQLQNNGTTIHFHGVRQHYTNQYDGVPSITQCPIAPGDQMTYTWRAEAYGSSWYHSHFSVQAWDGVFGPIKINGPTSAGYDVDAGHIILQDWSHETIFSQFGISEDAVAGEGGGARVMDNGLINGKNTWGTDGQANQTGERFKMDVEAGKSYLLRVVNIGIQSTYKFYIDGHSMTVISTDFTPIKPYTTNILNVNIGQRYDVIVSADQAPSTYWLRSDNQNACAGTIQALDIRGLFHYTTAPTTLTPTSTGYNYTPECVDESPSLHTPVLPLNPGTTASLTLDGEVTIGAPNNTYRWYLSGHTFHSSWSDPTLLDLVETGVAPAYSGALLISAPTANEWLYVIVESGIALPHPIHLHGHDFSVLATGAGPYAAGAVALHTTNPSRRDTVLMPGAGFVVVAFKADNPGAWLMHCHVGWHVSMGFAIQIVSQAGAVNGTVGDCGAGLRGTCANWDAWANARGLVTVDSGV